jgi:transposase
MVRRLASQPVMIRLAKSQTEDHHMQIKSVGIDLGKTTFHLIALGSRSQVVARKKFSRSQLLVYTANLPPSLIGMEAGVGSHFLGRALREQGHNVRLIPAQFVRPFVKSNKNDYCDAEAIAEAVERENMRFVPIKTEDQLDLQALHRVRDRLVARRTSVINQIRAFLLERGISFRKGPASLRRQMPEILENADEKLSARMRHLLDFLWQEWKGLQSQIESLNTDLEQIAGSDANCVRLQQIPGVGPLISTAVVSAIGNGAAFQKGREFAAWLGLVPRQWSTGGKPKLLGISKRGNPYLRRMFIHGARAAVLRVKREGSTLGKWMSGLETRAARNVVIVATANKLARISWAVLASGNEYQPMHKAVVFSN